MNPVVLDTNILLDIFVFNDERAINLKQALVDGSITAIASQKTLLELADVVSRPLFQLDEDAQTSILNQWQSISRLHDDSNLATAPWKCRTTNSQSSYSRKYSNYQRLQRLQALELKRKPLAASAAISNDLNRA